MFRFHRMRRVVYWSAGALLCLNSVPHVLPSIVRQNYEVQGTWTPESLQKHVQRIASAMWLPHPERISVFISNGFSSVSAGSTLLPNGAVIGLPRTVLYRTKSDVSASGMTVEGEVVDWDSTEGEKLLPLVLPSGEQMNFSIAHEVAHLQHKDVLYHIFLSPATLVISYHLATTIPKFVFPQIATPVFPLVLALCLLVYAHISTSISHWQEFRADRTAALCKSSYCHGGIEMMQKRLQLEDMYPQATHSSKYNFSLSAHPPVTKRLERLEQLVIQKT